MPTHIQNEIAKLNAPARDLAQVISDISNRIFKNEWNCDIEWDVRNAMDNGSSFTISNVKRELDPAQGRLNSSEVTKLQSLRNQLQDGWVHLDGLQPKRYGNQPLGSMRFVTAHEWNDTVGTDEYRTERYTIVD